MQYRYCHFLGFVYDIPQPPPEPEPESDTDSDADSEIGKKARIEHQAPPSGEIWN